MIRSVEAAIFVLALTGAVGTAGAGDWICTLPDTLTHGGGRLTLGELSTTEVPAQVADIPVGPGGNPGETIAITRRTILRELVSAGKAAGVHFRGAGAVTVRFDGRRVPPDALDDLIRGRLAPLLPVPEEGAPATWLEIKSLPDGLSSAGQWDLNVLQTVALTPGRQQVRFRFGDALRQETVAVTIVVHHHGEMARARRRIGHDEQLREDLFTWEWVDLSEGRKGRIVGRRALTGTCAARTLTAGAFLLEQDLKAVPVVRPGDVVELVLARAGVTVSVRAHARQEGCLGQTIPVRNELTGRLVNARVTGPGTVEWRQ